MITNSEKKVLFWHRRDLRIQDNAGLYEAFSNGSKVTPVFIFDQNILNNLEESDPRLTFIHGEIDRIKKEYQELGSDLIVYYGDPTRIIPDLAASLKCSKVYANRDYEPYAIQRDKKVLNRLASQNIDFFDSKDHVVFEQDEVLKDDGRPYLVFTPYSKKWKLLFTQKYVSHYDSRSLTSNLYKVETRQGLIQLNEMGFEKSEIPTPPTELESALFKSYEERRDFPSLNGTSKLVYTSDSVPSA